MNNPYHPYMNAAAWQGMSSQPGQPGAGLSPPYASYVHNNGMNNPAIMPAATATNANNASRFVKGVLIGAAVAYILSNEKVQQSTIKTAVKAWSLMQGGVEEMKERFRDAEAELHAAQMQDE